MTEAAVAEAPAVEPSAILAPAVSLRRLPWEGISTGQAAAGSITSEELLATAGLDWEVGIRPYKRELSDGTVVPSKRMFETYRVDTEDELGAVKKRYQVLQNRDAFSFGDSLVTGGAGQWTHAGFQGQGNRVFMTMRLEGEYMVLGKNPMETYLFFSTSHDGSRAIRAYVTPINAFCLNQTHLVEQDNTGSFSIQHTGSMTDKMIAAQESIKAAGVYSSIIKAEAEKLAAIRITDDKAREIVTSVIHPRRTNKDEFVDAVMNGYLYSPTVADYRGTGWGLLNAATEFYDHGKKQRSASARFESITFGEGAKARLQLARALAELN